MSVRCFFFGCKVSTVVIPATDRNAEWKFTSCCRCMRGYLTDKYGKRHPTVPVMKGSMRGDAR